MAFVPHAQERKNEIWIMPKRQCHSFALASVDEVDQLALAARSCLGMLYAAHDDPDYNILMRSAPSREIDAPGNSDTEPISDWYRWHLVIIPHDGEWGGIKGYVHKRSHHNVIFRVLRDCLWLQVRRLHSHGRHSGAARGRPASVPR